MIRWRQCYAIQMDDDIELATMAIYDTDDGDDDNTTTVHTHDNAGET